MSDHGAEIPVQITNLKVTYSSKMTNNYDQGAKGDPEEPSNKRVRQDLRDIADKVRPN